MPVSLGMPSLLLFLLTFSLTFGTLTVIGPEALVSSLTQRFGTPNITYTLANFGAIPYGRNSTGKLVIANPMTNCDYEDDLSEAIHNASCNSFLLLYRGDCSFVRKVRNAQQEGAKLAIVMDDTVEDSQHIVMRDDGHGRQVKIPSIFIKEESGQALIDWKQTYAQDVIQIRFMLETKRTEIAQLSLWLDGHSILSYEFVESLHPFFQKLQNKVNLKLYYNIVTGCTVCEPSDCVSEGKYCAAPIEGTNISGRAVLEQQLRQVFLLEKNSTAWWTYMSRFGKECLKQTEFQSCSKEIMSQLGYQWKEISERVQASYDSEGKNAFLDSTQQLKVRSGVFFFPDVVVNNVTFHGELDGIDVFQLLCNSLKKAPRDCLEFLEDLSTVEDLPITQNHGAKVAGIVIISLIVFLVLFVCVYRRFVKKRMNRDMTDQVNQLVTQYITLYESKQKEEEKQGA